MSRVRLEQEIFDALRVEQQPGRVDILPYVLLTAPVDKCGGIAVDVRRTKIAMLTAASDGNPYTGRIRVGSKTHTIKLLRARAYVRETGTATRRTLTTGRLSMNPQFSSVASDGGRSPAELVVSDTIESDDNGTFAFDFDNLAEVAAADDDLLYEGEIYLPHVVRDEDMGDGLAPLEFVWTRTPNAAEVDKAVLILHYLAWPKGALIV